MPDARTANAAAIKASSIGGRLKQHITWRPEDISVATSRQLAQALASAGVQLAHFHFGGNYGWGNRYFSKSPVLAVSRIATAHSWVPGRHIGRDSKTL